MEIRVKRGNQANLPVLSEGELAFTKDTKKLYVGTGTENVVVNSTQAPGDISEVKTVITAIKEDTADIQSNIGITGDTGGSIFGKLNTITSNTAKYANQTAAYWANAAYNSALISLKNTKIKQMIPPTIVWDITPPPIGTIDTVYSVSNVILVPTGNGGSGYYAYGLEVGVSGAPEDNTKIQYRVVVDKYTSPWVTYWTSIYRNSCLVHIPIHTHISVLKVQIQREPGAKTYGITSHFEINCHQLFLERE